MRIHHLGCGTMCPRGGGWLDGGESPFWGTASLTSHVLLIETDAHGLVLVDTGFGLADVADAKTRLGAVFMSIARPKLRDEDTAVRSLERLGYRADDVRHVVLTHMDLDHAGGLADFPNAKVHLTQAEHHAAIDLPTSTERRRYRSIQWAHGPDFETYEPDGEPWFGFAAVHDLVGLPPEILLVPLIGHSRGHSAVAVRNGPGWLLHCGDGYFHEDQVNPARAGCPAGLRHFQNLVAFDRPLMRHNQARLLELVRDHGDEVDVFSAHDVNELRRLQARAEARTDRAAE